MRRFEGRAWAALPLLLGINGCGSGLPGLNGYQGQPGSNTASLVGIYYGDSTVSGFLSDHIDTTQTSYGAITNGWGTGPSIDSNDLGALRFTGGGGGAVPIAYTSSGSGHYARVDFLFDLGNQSNSSVSGAVYQLDATGGCSTYATGVTNGVTSISSGGTWGVAWWNSAGGVWNVNSPSGNSVTPIFTGNGTPIPLAGGTLGISGLGGSGSYMILSLRSTSSCGGATGVLVQSVSLTLQ